MSQNAFISIRDFFCCSHHANFRSRSRNLSFLHARFNSTLCSDCLQFNSCVHSSWMIAKVSEHHGDYQCWVSRDVSRSRDMSRDSVCVSRASSRSRTLMSRSRSRSRREMSRSRRPRHRRDTVKTAQF